MNFIVSVPRMTGAIRLASWQKQLVVEGRLRLSGIIARAEIGTLPYNLIRWMKMMSRVLETPEYSVKFEPDAKMVRMLLRGHWDLEVTKRYDREFREGLSIMPAGGCPLGQHLAFVDLREFNVQSQDVLAILGGLSNDPSIAPKRTAIVLSSALLTMQARRVAPDYQLFSDAEAAMEWLKTGVDREA